MVKRLAGLVMGALLAGSSALAQTSAPPSRAAGLLGSALSAAETGDRAEALARANAAGGVARDMVEWVLLRGGHGTLDEYIRFLADKSHWPLINTVRRPAEALLAGQPPAQVLAFFGDRMPLTEAGHLALIDALMASGRRDDAQAHAVNLWTGQSLTPATEAALDSLFSSALRPHDAARADMLLWAGDRAGAQRIAPRLDDAHTRLMRARMALQERATGVDALVAAVPPALANHPGLAHDRFEFRMRAEAHDAAGDLLIAQSRDPAGLGQPEGWARRRIFLVRQAMGNGEFQRAYDLASPHGLDDGAQFADLEWLAGFIALTHLNQPETALTHFRALRVRASSPISLGRAGYWEGRAHEARGDQIAARAAYEFGAEHQTSYYGQWAADRLGLPLDPSVFQAPTYPDWQQTALAQSDLLAATKLLLQAGQWHEARRFVLALSRTLTDEPTLGALTDLLLEMGEPNFALNIAKLAVQDEIVLPRAYFPVTDLAQGRFPVPMDLVKAIARRESEFDPAVVSPADARGLMQVLPGTGQMMARKLGIPFDAADLTRNADLNARLGAAYLAELRDEFGPSLALVASGYNAGPGRPRQWIPRLGDPRDPSVDIITWVESVPFAETRNYIMRVAESQVIYRALLAGQSGPIGMDALLRGR